MQAGEENVEIKEESDISEGADSRVYEVGYLLVPTLKEEDVPAAYGNLKELISSLGGEAISDEMPRMIPLAYNMQKVISNVRSKFSSAYFGWIKFYMKPSGVLQLKSKLDMDNNFIRFLIIKTVKENTIAAKRFVRDDMAHRKAVTPKKEAGVVTEIDKEEIDKEIEAMVAV